MTAILRRERSRTLQESRNGWQRSNSIVVFSSVFAYRMLGSVADAEDMLQEAVIRWQHASGDEIRFASIMITIIRLVAAPI